MKRPIAIFILCMILSGSTQAQFPYWDLRSTSTYTANIGFGFQLNKQTSRLYFFSEIDVCLSCKRNALRLDANSIADQLNSYTRSNRNKLSFSGRFQFYRDFELYDRVYNNNAAIVEPSGQAYTFENSISFRFTHYNLKGVNPSDYTEVGKRTNNLKWDFEYGIKSVRHTGSQNYLSNFIGFYKIRASELFDYYGLEFGWMNDGPVHMHVTKWLLPVFDHGLTNELYIEGYYRPWIQGLLIGEGENQEPFNYRNDGVIRLKWYHQIITDRNIHLDFPSFFARNGMYQTLDYDGFHFYRGLSLSYEGGFTRDRQDIDQLKSHLLFKLRAELFQDHLMRGRRVQRFIHQGLTHRSVYRRRNSLIQNNGLVNSPLFPWEKDIDFHKYYPFMPGIETSIFYNAK